MTLSHTIIDSPIDALTLVGEAERGRVALRAVWMRSPRHVQDAAELGVRDDDAFAAPIEQLNEYFAGERTQFDLTLDAQGNDFQKRVWVQLLAIPYGQTRSYGQLAADLGDPNLSRAVGSANGRNPISIIVPCHRVIGADGSLTGYGGGIERKRFLLALERGDGAADDQLF
ncbi:methylated-DNA-[protein]-cysteine S-methyltransferase [Paramicrobacterium humi]|uniref:Methylated-DNA--protein-cysteine methyltransferase n=1 Tax=Paramicrobacterium humi TaxID=640635 RepID=A0A1H4J9Z8_9MICO|nr:methylated-DNA--[protein]-cysteine S-methyltransferase [Microbacterium humi]SEB43149.1 methylated-DNA-[protein]-cysteine S-methyltransferase [Microbacterium humi]